MTIRRSQGVILSATALSADNTYPIDISQVDRISVQLVYSAATNGNVIKLQVSNDGSNWDDLGSHSLTIAAAAGNKVFEVGEVSARYLRVFYDHNSGSTTLSIYTGTVRS